MYAPMARIRVGVIGASGYAGGELVRWLAGHPGVGVVRLAAGESAGREVDAVWPNLRGFADGPLAGADARAIARECDALFLALPTAEGIAAAAEALEEECRVVDVGAGFRLEDPALFRLWYGTEHAAPALLEEAVYGLPELNCEAIPGARLVANPGCYPTAAAIALAPLVREGYAAGPAVIDAKSGISGAGRALSERTRFGEVNENVRPYDVGGHRHQPEIEQTLRRIGRLPGVFFAPHLVPMTRGILASCYLPLDRPLEPEEALELYRDAYAGAPFVRVLDELPQTKATAGSNFCDVTVRVDAERGLAAAYAALDNLGKGAATQAIQNLNLMFGLPETEGLWSAPIFP